METQTVSICYSIENTNWNINRFSKRWLILILFCIVSLSFSLVFHVYFIFVCQCEQLKMVWNCRKSTKCVSFEMKNVRVWWGHGFEVLMLLSLMCSHFWIVIVSATKIGLNRYWNVSLEIQLGKKNRYWWWLSMYTYIYLDIKFRIFRHNVTWYITFHTI